MVRKASTKLSKASERLDRLIQEAHRNGRRWSGRAAALEYASRKLSRSLDSDSTPSVSHSRYVPRVPIGRGLHDLPAMRLIREITDQLRMVHGVSDIDDHVDVGCTVAVVLAGVSRTDLVTICGVVPLLNRDPEFTERRPVVNPAAATPDHVLVLTKEAHPSGSEVALGLLEASGLPTAPGQSAE